MSNSESKNPKKSQKPNYKRFVSGSGETILPENAQVERETNDSNDSETSSGFRLPEEFTLVRRIGRGGMGEVYLVERDSGFSREQLAIKTILPEHLGNEGAIERFKREVETLLRLRHDHIVQLRDFRLYRGYYYFLMEYIEGVTLQERVEKQGALTPSEVLEIFSPLAQALDYAHSKGVIHRDLKPSNIMLGSNGTVYLLDFGIAQHQESEHTLTRRMGPGTWEYMSPEQFDNDNPTVSMDVYGLGATIYFALTGNHPFDATSIRKLLLQKDSGCPDVSMLRLPDGIAEGLKLSMNPNPDSRSRSCVELMESMKGVSRKKSEATDLANLQATTGSIRASVGDTLRHVMSPVNVFPDEITNSFGMKFRLITAGTFMMGSPEGEFGRLGREKQFQVTLSKSFYIGIFPVTQLEYRQVMGCNPSRFQGDNRPVEQVSWLDCFRFINKLNVIPEEMHVGRVYGLPTEAEWEYACRAGSSGMYSFGDDMSQLDKHGWYCENSFRGRWLGMIRVRGTHPVGLKNPNPWGLYDMHGNVWEWCNDWYNDYPSDSKTNPVGASTGTFRVRRGGGWNDRAINCRSANRFRGDPTKGYNNVGLRLALSVIDPT